MSLRKSSHADLVLATAQESDRDALVDVLSHAFGFPAEDARPWFARAGLENIRTLRRGGGLSGALIEIPMGQWFGGRSVTTMGVAGVAVTPAERGRGVGAHLMVSMLAEARRRGFALSTLYPATVALYRRVGYERAGARFSISFDPRTCDVPRVPEMTVAEVDGVPEDAVALYRSLARRTQGYLDRGPYVWSRITKPQGRSTKTFTVSHDGVLEGYVVLYHVMSDDASSVTVTDLSATTSRAASAILRILVEYRSLATRVKWHGGPSDLFTNLLPERHCEIHLTDHFMTRIIDVAAALSQRGWPSRASGSLAFEVHDASLPENSGLYTVTLEGGTAKVTLGASPSSARVKITERGLAALYTGHAQAHVVAMAGWLDANDDVCAILDDWFRASYPVTRDFF